MGVVVIVIHVTRFLGTVTSKYPPQTPQNVTLTQPHSHRAQDSPLLEHEGQYCGNTALVIHGASPNLNDPVIF
jgi:hypothetical protein